MVGGLASFGTASCETLPSGTSCAKATLDV
jgi:hypothetical protein